MEVFSKSSVLIILIVVLQLKGSNCQCDGVPITYAGINPFTSNILPVEWTSSYPINAMCNWIIDDSSADMKILYKVDDATIDCGDTLTLRDGKSSSSQLLQEICTNTPGASYKQKATSQQSLLITLKTDENEIAGKETGFTVRFMIGMDLSQSNQACNGEVLDLTATSSEQYLTSPNFPGRRPKNVQCHYRITAKDPDATVTVELRVMDIDKFNDKCVDTLKIIEDSYHRVVCGTNNFNPEISYTSTGSTIKLEYANGKFVDFYGFALAFKQNAPKTTTTTTTAPKQATKTGTLCATAESFWKWLGCHLRKIGEDIRNALFD